MKVSARMVVSLLIVGMLAIIVTVMMVDINAMNEQNVIVFSNCVIIACLTVYIKFINGFDMSSIMMVFAWAFSIGGLLPELFDLTDRRRVIGYYSEVVICAACLFAGGGAIVLAGALVPVAAAAYSAMLFAPALHTRVKAGFDKVNAKRTRHPSAKARKRGE